ncbi:hypothetical protein ACEPAG_1435 [Sanghuangporus baumii]
MAHNNFDSDRRSAVSSFYGGRGRKSSFDMLASDVNMRSGSPMAPSVSRHDRDDASSFFAADGQRRSQDLLTGQSAGYNRASYFDVGRTAPVKGINDDEDAAFLGARPGPGRDEEAGWDVYADFNNAGPRYSSAFVKYDQTDGYQPLPPETTPRVHTPVKLEEDTATSSRDGPVELVTVPALGAEWKKSELEAMTKKGRRRRKDSNRMDNFRAWWRDQRGCCGRWGTRKHIAIGAFILCSIIGVILAFTIPRVPAISFNSSSPLLNGTAPPDFIFSRSPANFSFPAKLDLRVDTGSNFLPLDIHRMTAEISDLDTGQKVGTGNMSITLSAKKIHEVQLPLNITYLAINDTDRTWVNWYDACRNAALYTDGKRPGVDMKVQLDLKIAGLIGSRRKTAQITNVACPFELPQNSV